MKSLEQTMGVEQMMGVSNIEMQRPNVGMLTF